MRCGLFTMVIDFNICRHNTSSNLPLANSYVPVIICCSLALKGLTGLHFGLSFCVLQSQIVPLFPGSSDVLSRVNPRWNLREPFLLAWFDLLALTQPASSIS